MNENKRDVLNLILCFFLGFTVALAITIPIFVSSSRRADIELGELSARLQESDRRSAELKSTLESCREPVERITDFATRGDGTLTGIIENLKNIRSEVQILEERVYSIDNNSGDNDSLNNSAVEKIGGEQ